MCYKYYNSIINQNILRRRDETNTQTKPKTLKRSRYRFIGNKRLLHGEWIWY